MDYEIVLHAEEMRLPIIGDVMSMAEHFADEIVPETSEFDVEDYSEVVDEECVEGETISYLEMKRMWSLPDVMRS